MRRRCARVRYRAAQKLGLETIPVHVAVGLSPEQLRAYRIADNKTGELADWDQERLVQELMELENLDFDLVHHAIPFPSPAPKLPFLTQPSPHRRPPIPPPLALRAVRGANVAQRRRS